MARQTATAALSVERFFQFSLLGLVASGFLAVAGSGYLDTPTIALTAAGLLLRGLVVCGWVPLRFSERAVTVATISYAGFFLVDYLLLSRGLLLSCVHLLFFLAVVKTLTAKTSRDFLYTAVIAFVELLAAAVLSIGLGFFIFLALFLLFAIAALSSGEIRRSLYKTSGPPAARDRLKRFYPRLALLSGFVTLGILALTAGLFFLLPRTADAAFASLVSHRIFLPGFSNSVTLGEIGLIKTSSRPVMHIRVYSGEQSGGLKWRGNALTHFDGKVWTNQSPSWQRIGNENSPLDRSYSEDRRPGRHLNYDVMLDAVDSKALFFAGTPERFDFRSQSLFRTEVARTDTGSFRLGGQPPEGFHYAVYSRLEDTPETALAPYPPPELTAAARSRELQLPKLDPRIPALARAMAGGASTDLERARAVERRLRRDYGYTLELPNRQMPDPLADFLFVRKKGYCEYFASAMSVLLRTLGIPARLATGFQSGIYNPITDLWVVRASDAHAWVEAWIPGLGWASFDPTPPDTSAQSFTLLTQLGLYMDAAETFWHEWVVGYDPRQQGKLADRLQEGASRLGFRWFDSLSGTETNWGVYAAAWFRSYGMRVMALLAVGMWVWFFGRPVVRWLRMRLRVERVRRGQAGEGDATLLYGRMLHILERHGYQKPVWFTPVEFAASIPNSSLGSAVAKFTTTYNELRFGGRTGVAQRLSFLLDDLERATCPKR